MARRNWLATLSMLVCVTALSRTSWADPVQGGWLPGQMFPSDNWWNVDVTWVPVDWRSDDLLNQVGRGMQMHPDVGGNYWDDLGERNYGLPFITVDGGQPRVAVDFLYSTVSDGVDHGTGQSYPFYPIPEQAIWNAHWIQGGLPGFVDVRQEDRHMLIVDRDNNCLYELFNVWFDVNAWRWQAGSGTFFDLSRNDRRPDGWPSADESGLAILPGSLRYDEVYGPDEIQHALRISAPDSNGWVFPASNGSRWSPGAMPLGARLRLKPDFDISGYAPEVQKIFRAMKRYGTIVGTVAWTYIVVSGTYDVRWNNDIMNPAFHSLTADNFEVLQLGWQP
jgi:hypothetical protein